MSGRTAPSATTCRVGDFVEMKNSSIGDGTKISHLTYVGDSDVGERVNFGCGTVTTNYDGHKKFRCTIGDDVFIGCNTNLIAPVTLGDACLHRGRLHRHGRRARRRAGHRAHAPDRIRRAGPRACAKAGGKK